MVGLCLGLLIATMVRLVRVVHGKHESHRHSLLNTKYTNLTDIWLALGNILLLLIVRIVSG